MATIIKVKRKLPRWAIIQKETWGPSPYLCKVRVHEITPGGHVKYVPESMVGRYKAYSCHSQWCKLEDVKEWIGVATSEPIT